MKLHANARTCPNSRRLLVERVRERGWSVMAAAEAAGISERTGYRWLARFREEGEPGLLDRSSAPRRIPHRTPAERVEAIQTLRRLRMTAAEIAELLSMPISTVSAWLKRIGLGKRSRLEPPEPPNRYELPRPGQLVHIDIKKLGRISDKGAGHRLPSQETTRLTPDEPDQELQLAALLRGAALEALDTTAGVHQLLAARVERVAVRADLDVELGLRRARRELVAARAPHASLDVLGMNRFLHECRV